MFSIIILENEASIDEVAQSIKVAREQVRNLGGGQITVIGNLSTDLAQSGETYLSTKDSSTGECLVSAISAARGERVVVFGASHGSDIGELSRVIAELCTENGPRFTYVPISWRNEIIELPELEVGGLPSVIGGYDVWPLSIVSLDTATAQNALPLSADRSQPFMAQLLVKMLSQMDTVGASYSLFNMQDELDAYKLHELGNDERAACLQVAVNANNIEDLFPNHPWSMHGEESAAASYHSLAAVFIRLGDFASASTCLELSDRLEESPRSLALKGLLAMQRGEVLGAVANMVSSLQHYEMRKRETGDHYLHFSPSDLEGINAKLSSGLAALNRRENLVALEHFADAVFSFDPFYRQFGVDRVRRASVQ